MQAFSSRIDRLIDFSIACATTEVPCKRVIHLLECGLRMFSQKSHTCKQDTWSAIATLCSAQLGKRFLQRIKLPVHFQSLDSGNLAVLNFDRQSKTRKNR